MQKRHRVFTENFTIFFSNAGKTENVPEFRCNKFLRPPFRDDIDVTFTSQELVPWIFKQVNIFTNFI